ncbi:MAG: hypothetical protein ACRDP3_16855 [Streptomyces sp.]|uniref:hypothetical protein n=1 Tax=Streptomyces sp. TaxID=1931 RepID=UPI003D6A9D0C
MPKQGRGTSSGTDLERAGTPPLPDLTGVDLCVLRAMDAPALLAAVDAVLDRPERFTETWWGDDGGQAGKAS